MQGSFNAASPRRRRPGDFVATLAAGFIGNLILLVTCGSAGAALTKEQAIANCRETVGRPIVMACMRASGGGEANFARCRENATPKVKACVIAALNAANGRANVPIEMYKSGELKQLLAEAGAVPA